MALLRHRRAPLGFGFYQPALLGVENSQLLPRFVTLKSDGHTAEVSAIAGGQRLIEAGGSTLSIA